LIGIWLITTIIVTALPQTPASPSPPPELVGVVWALMSEESDGRVLTFARQSSSSLDRTRQRWQFHEGGRFTLDGLAASGIDAPPTMAKWSYHNGTKSGASVSIFTEVGNGRSRKTLMSGYQIVRLARNALVLRLTSTS
jgi:hypothetical protein